MSLKKNIINISIVILLLANIITLGLFWFRKAQPAPDQRSILTFLSQELNFDAKQQESLKQLLQQHRDETKETRDKVREGKDKFFDLLNNENISDSAIEKASYAAVESQRQMDIMVFAHFRKIKALCNTEQKKKFDEIINEALHRMARPAAPPPPGAERPDGPPPGP